MCFINTNCPSFPVLRFATQIVLVSYVEAFRKIYYAVFICCLSTKHEVGPSMQSKLEWMNRVSGVRWIKVIFWPIHMSYGTLLTSLQNPAQRCHICRIWNLLKTRYSTQGHTSHPTSHKVLCALWVFLLPCVIFLWSSLFLSHVKPEAISDLLA